MGCDQGAAAPAHVTGSDALRQEVTSSPHAKQRLQTGSDVSRASRAGIPDATRAVRPLQTQGWPRRPFHSWRWRWSLALSVSGNANAARLESRDLGRHGHVWRPQPQRLLTGPSDTGRRARRRGGSGRPGAAFEEPTAGHSSLLALSGQDGAASLPTAADPAKLLAEVRAAAIMQDVVGTE